MGFGQRLLNLWRPEALDAKADGLDEEGHVQPQLAHGLHPLMILIYLVGHGAMGNGPILRGDNGHVGLEEILVKCIHRGGGSSPTGYADGGADLHRPIGMKVGVEQPVEQSEQGTIGGCEVDGRTNEQAISLAHLGRDVVHYIIEPTDACVPTSVASDATMDGEVSDMYPLGVNTLLLERALHFVQGRCGVSFGLGATIENQYLHLASSLLQSIYQHGSTTGCYHQHASIASYGFVVKIDTDYGISAKATGLVLHFA